jgi:hypothetical protein
VLLDEHVAGFAEYHRNGNIVSFTHTVIDPGFEGWARSWPAVPWTPPDGRDTRCCRSARSSAGTSSAIPPIWTWCPRNAGQSLT